MRRRECLIGFTTLPVAGLAQTARSGWAPQRPLTLIAPFSAGSGTDILARIMAPALAVQLGVQVVVENRGGAGGTLGTGAAVRARPDGHTLVVSGTSTISINRALYRDLGFDLLADLAPVGVAVTSPNALVVAATGPYQTLVGLVAALRDPNRRTRHWSTGNGTSQHLSGVQLLRAVGGTAEHVPYRGPAEGVAGLLAGDTEWGFSNLTAVIGLARAGSLKVLGVTGTEPDPALPDAPTLASQGLAAFAETNVWNGLSVSRAIPAEALTALRTAFQRAQPVMAERLAHAGFTPAPPMEPAALDAYMERQAAFWAELVREAGARIE